jgi:NADP-dependent 3-hydroxy acid dehydrogenase YdfG
MQPLADRIFVITGAGGAIAAPIARALGRAGARLILVGHDERSLDDLGRETGGQPLAADLVAAGGAEAMARAVVERHGRVDGLVHTVGGFALGRVVDSDGATYDRMFDLNVRSLFNVLRAVVPGMLARGDGFVCGISSEPGWTGRSPGTALYGAAKSAATSMLRSLDLEARNTMLSVCILYPMGAVDTPANRRDMPGVDPATFIDPDELAATVVHAATRGPRGRLSELPVHPPRPRA